MPSNPLGPSKLRGASKLLVAPKLRGASPGSPGGHFSGGAVVADAYVTVGSVTSGVSVFRHGLNVTQAHLESPGTAAAKLKWEDTSGFSFQHILSANFGPGSDIRTAFGGANNYNNGSNTRIQWQRDTNQQLGAILGLCPNYLKQYKSGSGATSIQINESAPVDATAELTEFADICGDAAANFSDVDWWQCWNEMKGMGTNHARYLRLFNPVYDAVKAANANALVGGPSAQLQNWLASDGGGQPATDSQLRNRPWGTMNQAMLTVTTAWLSGKTNARDDVFWFWDGMGWGVQEASPQTWAWQVAANRAWWADIVQWFRALPNGGTTGSASMPIIASEYYTGPYVEWQDKVSLRAPTPSTTAQLNERRVMGMLIVVRAMLAGMYSIHYWSPEGKTDIGDQGIWRNSSEGAGAYPLYQPLKDFKTHFPPGAVLFPASSTDPMLECIATATRVQIINLDNVSKTISVNNAPPVTIGGHDVLLYVRP